MQATQTEVGEAHRRKYPLNRIGDKTGAWCSHRKQKHQPSVDRRQTMQHALTKHLATCRRLQTEGSMKTWPLSTPASGNPSQIAALQVVDKAGEIKENYI